jgi:hypothetical protein
MTTEIRDLVTSYIDAVGDHRLDVVAALLAPSVEFTVGDRTLSGPDAVLGAFERLSPIILRNEIRRVFVDGDEACVIYDFVTDTTAGAVLSVEHVKVIDNRLASILLVFERLHWAEASAELAARVARPAASAAQ